MVSPGAYVSTIQDIPIVNQRFPLRRSSENIGPSTFHHQTQSAPPASPVLQHQTPNEAGTSSSHSPAPESLASPTPQNDSRPRRGRSTNHAVAWEHKVRKIRSIDQSYSLYRATSSTIVDGSPVGDFATIPSPRVGDICFQTDGEPRAWIFAEHGWESAVEGSNHPTLKGYICHFQEGTVRWVQKKSIQTYGYRKKD